MDDYLAGREAADDEAGSQSGDGSEGGEVHIGKQCAGKQFVLADDSLRRKYAYDRLARSQQVSAEGLAKCGQRRLGVGFAQFQHGQHGYRKEESAHPRREQIPLPS